MKEKSYELFFLLFCNKTRLEIVYALRKKPMSVKELSEKLGYEQSRISHNLSCLKHCGFVESKKNGKETIYYLDEQYILPLLRILDKFMKVYEERLKTCKVIK